MARSKKYIISRTYSSAKQLRVRLGLYCKACVEPEVRSNDVWLTSYPKSGNTYLRFLIASTLAGKEIDFFKVDQYVPDIYQVSKHHLMKMASPRIMKSHELARKDYANVFYIVRDPRKVVLSYAYWANRALADEEVEKNMDKIVLDWMNRKDKFWSWSEHMEGWFSILDTKQTRQKFKWIRYEDLISEPAFVLKEFFDAFGISVLENNIELAVKNCSQAKMQQAELASKPFFTSTNRSFVRVGKKPKFDEVVSAPVRKIFEEKYSYWLNRFKYI